MWGRRSFGLLGLLGSLVCFASPARAQSIVLSDAIRRVQPFRDQGPKRYWINYEDCRKDDVFTFQAVLISAASYELQVWAGPTTVDCAATENRNPVVGPCWLVAIGNTYQTPIDIEVRARDVVGHRFGSDPSFGPGSGTIEDCDGTGGPTGVQVALYFLLLSSTTAVAENVFPSPEMGATFGFDLMGVQPPVALTAKGGFEKLAIEWEPYWESGLGVFAIFCDEASNGPECASPKLIPGAMLEYRDKCGFTSKTQWKASVGGLTNGVKYAVGVSEGDDVGNLGPLSELACATPVDDTDLNGRACSFARARTDTRVWSFVVPILAFCLLRHHVKVRPLHV